MIGADILNIWGSTATVVAASVGCCLYFRRETQRDIEKMETTTEKRLEKMDVTLHEFRDNLKEFRETFKDFHGRMSYIEGRCDKILKEKEV